MKVIKEKIKTVSFWSGLAAGLVILLQSLGQVFGFTVSEKHITDIIMAICGILVVLGIVNKPEKKQENNKSENVQENTVKSNNKQENINEESQEN